jgi:hypothetical protein
VKSTLVVPSTTGPRGVKQARSTITAPYAARSCEKPSKLTRSSSTVTIGSSTIAR